MSGICGNNSGYVVKIEGLYIDTYIRKRLERTTALRSSSLEYPSHVRNTVGSIPLFVELF